ncbi:hypothetical protein BDV96DRAFT_224542 [Lophiotrema nucula]|uniref:Uncharacterized protein n=1 Tax=Lophiotrema nucula TaxID=690887 RepID=A0A6A5YT64_9PLEO|nr:hypothetical protein BDV96DRAFT_224542 [Lophiotrema nucula]
MGNSRGGSKRCCWSLLLYELLGIECLHGCRDLSRTLPKLPRLTSMSVLRCGTNALMQLRGNLKGEIESVSQGKSLQYAKVTAPTSVITKRADRFRCASAYDMRRGRTVCRCLVACKGRILFNG